METETRIEISSTRKILDRHYPVLVIDPYSINIKDTGPNKGDVRLSFYSAFVAHAAREIIEAGIVDEVVLFDDASFGSSFASTGDLTFDYLTRDRVHQDSHVGPIFDKKKVHLYKGNNYTRTSPQVEETARFIKERGLQGNEVLYLGWNYHKERVENHAKGFGLSVVYASVEYANKHFNPDFDLDKLYNVLPVHQIEDMEKNRRRVSRFDRKGVMPTVIQSIRGERGAYMLDNIRMPDGTLIFDYRPGKDRLIELGLE